MLSLVLAFILAALARAQGEGTFLYPPYAGATVEAFNFTLGSTVTLRWSSQWETISLGIRLSTDPILYEGDQPQATILENTKNKNETDWIVATNSNLLVNPTFYFVIFDDQYDDYFLSQYFNIVLSSSATTFTTSSMTVDSLATLPLSSVPTSIPTITTRPSTTNSTLSFYPVNYTTAILNRTTATGVASPSLRTDGTYPTSTAETTIPFSGLPPIAGIGIGTATVAALCIAFFAVYWYKRYRKLQAESRLPPCPLKVAEPRMHQNGGCLILIGPQEAPTAGTSIAEVHGDGMAPTQELDGSQIER